MGHIFSKKATKITKVTQQDKAVLQLKQQRDKLKQYQKRIENKLESDRTLAKTLIKDGKKDRAKLLLSKKRYQEQLLQRTEDQLDNLERMTQDLEFAQVEIQVVEGLKIGNEALKKVNEVLNIEDIERILDETKEGIEKQQEIDDMLSGFLTDEDQDAVLSELDDLIKESLPNVPSEEMGESIELPDVPETEIEVKEKKSKTKDDPIALEA